jgi:N-acetylneuraminic acid mutarotase
MKFKHKSFSLTFILSKKKMNFINYLYTKKTLYIFHILVLVGIFVIKIDSFTGERAGHTSVLIGSRLYFFGGIKINTFLSDEVFYLDISKSFTIESPPWVDLTIHAKMPFGSAMTTMSLVYINDEPIVYLFGGLMYDPITDINLYVSNVHTFNPKTLEWNVPSIEGKEPLKRRNIRGASDDTGKIYIFSGFRNSDFYFYDEMLILDTVNSKWSYGSKLNMPIQRAGYSATMLKNGVIVYIGGSLTELQITEDINHIFLYDTKNDTWSSMVRVS